ncbi:MAG TPA: hypothetical protein VNW90_25405 [Acetobacteraceae bacterium]|nr:hypothetical protein [Acetobacteraceae bacterium]
MPQAICRLKSASPISFSRHHGTPKKTREQDMDYEERTWREKAHYDEQGMVYIPANMISSTFKASALYLGMKIPGKGTSTYTKHIDAGVIVLEGIDLGVHKDALEEERLFCSANGKRGGSRRVKRIFPIVRRWEGTVTFYVGDPIVTEDAFLQHLKVMGKFIGFGRWRPRNGGLYGRCDVIDCAWQQDEEEAAA